MQYPLRMLLVLAGAYAFGLTACGSDDPENDNDNDTSSVTSTTGSPEQVGAACEAASDCYPDVAGGELSGDALCLSEVRGGYCTHICAADADCCAAEGECATDLMQVCSPFQSTGQMMCFLSCEPGDITGGLDEQEYCQREASRDFICRSSGGGSANRKICVPGDCGLGAACAGDADCSGDLTCVTQARGGYCTLSCAATADCPSGSRCVAYDAEHSYCYQECDAESDCSFCRGDELRGSCTTDLDFVDGDNTVTVCSPPR